MMYFFNRLLLEWGAGIHAKTTHGNTAAHLAAHRGHAEVVHIFLRANFNTSLVNNKGHTLTETASLANQLKVVKLLKW